jgi:hypothetical protein
MAFSHVQSTGAQQAVGVGATLAKAFTSNNTAGNLLCVFGAAIWNGTFFLSCADSKGNSYTGFSNNGSTDGTIINYAWFAYNVASGANTVTIQTSDATSPIMSIGIAEYSGEKVSSTPADHNGNNFNTGTAANVGATVSGSNELVWAGIGVINGGSYTITAGQTSRFNVSSTSTLIGVCLEDVLSRSSDILMTWTISSSVSYGAAAGSFLVGPVPWDASQFPWINSDHILPALEPSKSIAYLSRLAGWVGRLSRQPEPAYQSRRARRMARAAGLCYA